MESTTLSTTIPARRLQAVVNHTTGSSSPSIDTSKDDFLLVLPDGGKIGHRIVQEGEKNEVILNGSVILTYTISETQSYSLEISSVNTRYHGATAHFPKYPLVILSTPLFNSYKSQDVSIQDFWAAVYALFTLYKENEHIPVIFASIPNAAELKGYLTMTGLARTYPTSDLDSPTAIKAAAALRDILFLNRGTFWQGAGTTGYHRRSWLLNHKEPFPVQPAFTRNEKVIAAHPLRPPKPQPGEVLYRRWCTHVSHMIELTYFDLEGLHDGSHSLDGLSTHMVAFHKWHNDERVNSAWGERGSLETHREYVNNVLQDPHVWPCMFSWDGELMGYVEIVYVKEDHVAQHYPLGVSPGNWERGVHVLVGENKFLGGGRSEVWLRSLVHYIFMADPRTDRVIGEPSEANKSILRVAENSGFHSLTTIDFSYKRSWLLHNPREKFFRHCRLW